MSDIYTMKKMNCFKPLTLKSKEHLISSYNISNESLIKVRKIVKRKLSATKEAPDCLTNSPGQYLKKCIENTVENMHTDVRA